MASRGHALIERGGNVRTLHVVQANKDNVAAVVTENVARESAQHDESRLYTQVGKTFAAHETVKHSAGDTFRGPVHSNTIESYFSIFKRGMRGTYQHCAEKHLHRYLAEFDFRHNNRVALGVNDVARAGRILGGITGKRLTYRTNSRKVRSHMASGDHSKSAKKPSGKKKIEISQKEQSERFKRAARELDADESGDAFDRAVGRVLKPRPTS